MQDTICILPLMQATNKTLGGVGLIGLGEVGEIHADAIRSSSVACLAAVADLDAGLVSRYATDRTRGYDSLDGLLSDPGVGTVSICLPHNLHFDAASAAIAAGKNVLVEKPLTISLEDGDVLIRAAKTAGVTLGVSHNQLFFSAHRDAKDRIESGTLGDPVFLRMRLGTTGPWGGWRASTDAVGGGFLMDAGIHRLYMATYFFGPVAECHAVLDATREERETMAVITLRFESGAWGVIEANQHGPERMFEDEIEIIGTKAALRLPGVESKFRNRETMWEFVDRAWHAVPVEGESWAETVSKSVCAYLAAVRAGEAPPTSGAEAMETMRLLYRIYDSAVLLGHDEDETSCGTSRPRLGPLGVTL